MKIKQFKFSENADLTIDVFADDAIINAEPFTVDGLLGLYAIADVDPDGEGWLVAIGWNVADDPREYIKYFPDRTNAAMALAFLPAAFDREKLAVVGFEREI